MEVKEIKDKKMDDVRTATIKAPTIIKKDDVRTATIKAPTIIKKNIIPYETQTSDNFERISQPNIDSLNSNNYIHDDIPYRTPLKEEEGLSNNDKQEFYPFILKYLDDLVKNDYNTHEIDDIIEKERFQFPRNDKKKEKIYEILRIVFFALYKAKDKQDLIDHLRVEYLYMDRNEIDKLIEEIRTELKLYAGEELYKNWIQNSKDTELEELINILTKENQKESSIFLTEKKSQTMLTFDNKYREELIQYLDIAIPELLSFYSISELNAEDIRKHALEIFDNAVNNGMTQNMLNTPYNSNKMSLILIFYALLDLGIKSLGITSIGQADIGRALIKIYNKLNFSNIDTMIYLKPKIIHNFLSNRLKNLLDSLPSPKLIIFNNTYKNELKNYITLISKDIIAKYSISKINEIVLVNQSLELFNQALDNKLTPDDLKKNRKPNQLALMLIYFSLIHYEIYVLGDETINFSLILDSINDFARLGFKNKESLYNIYPIYLQPFLPEIYKIREEKFIKNKEKKFYEYNIIDIQYNQDFRKELENNIKFIATKILNVKNLENIKINDIISESLRLFDNALKVGLKPNDLGRYRFVRYLTICLIYFSLVSLNVTSLGSGALSVRDITDIIAEDYDKLGFGSEDAMKFGCGLLINYIPQDIIEKANKIPQTQGIVFNKDYYNDLERYITFIAEQVKSHYNLNIDIQNITSLAIKILEDCISNGLEPSDLGNNKSSSFTSIILLYYALISLKVINLGIGTITVSKIVDLLVDNYEKIGFSSFWFSDRVVAGRIYSFLPQNIKEIVDLLPERELPKGKYESICKKAFDEIFSELYKTKIKFIPHLSLFKLIADERNDYINEYIKRAHLDGGVKLPFPIDGILNSNHRLFLDIEIPTNVNEIEYNVVSIDSLEIQWIIEKIKIDFIEKNLKLIKIQFPFGHIKILIKNNKIFLYERESYKPLNCSNEDSIWITYEYNGIQHYVFPNYFHKDLNKLDSFLYGIINDFLKIYILNNNGKIIFEFPYWISHRMNQSDKIKSYIRRTIKSYFNF